MQLQRASVKHAGHQGIVLYFHCSCYQTMHLAEIMIKNRDNNFHARQLLGSRPLTHYITLLNLTITRYIYMAAQYYIYLPNTQKIPVLREGGKLMKIRRGHQRKSLFVPSRMNCNYRG